MFSENYNTGRQIRRGGDSVIACVGEEQVNGYWREDQEITSRQRKPKQLNGLNLLIKPQAAGLVGYRAA